MKWISRILKRKNEKRVPYEFNTMIGNYCVQGGLTFELCPNHQAEVVGCEQSYSGNLDVPNKIEHKGVSYVVSGIGCNAFRDCKELTSVRLPESVIWIKEFAFLGCVKLIDLELSCNLKSIGRFAFQQCIALERLFFPKALSVLEFGVCAGCMSLQEIVVDEENKTFASGNGLVYSKDMNTLVLCPPKCKCTNLKDSVQHIAKGAFMSCLLLRDIQLPLNVLDIGSEAFSGCIRLNSVVFPATLTSMGDDVFYANIMLTKITCKAATPPLCTDYTFGRELHKTVLIVPKGCAKSYRESMGWKGFAQIVEDDKLS